MYFSGKPAPESTWRALRALRLSLNAPVVAVEELPIGPARAGIALGDGPDGAPRVIVAVRSVRTGRLAFYAPGEEPGDRPSSALAMDAALSFAESMGFLFDDDEVEARGDAGPVEAARTWCELIGADPPPEAEPAEADALLLDQVVAPAPVPLPLTKFRRTAAGAASGARGPTPAAATRGAGRL